MQNTDNGNHPRVFISYSWDSEEHVSRVMGFATDLMGDGIDVLLDRWSVMEGDDLFAFMERAATDPTVDYVLVLITPNYTARADRRKGGVGTETQIITPVVYGRIEQSKVLPIIFSRDGDGNCSRPAYLTSRLHFDLTDPSEYQMQYRAIVRRIWGVSETPKPHLGAQPSWLDSDNNPQDYTIDDGASLLTVRDGDHQTLMKHLTFDEAFDVVCDDDNTVANDEREGRLRAILLMSDDILRNGANLILVTKSSVVTPEDNYYLQLVRDMSERTMRGLGGANGRPHAAVAYLELSDNEESVFQSWVHDDFRSCLVQIDAMPTPVKLLPRKVWNVAISRLGLSPDLHDAFRGADFEDVDELERALAGSGDGAATSVVHVHKHETTWTKRLVLEGQIVTRLTGVGFWCSLIGVIGFFASSLAGLSSQDDWLIYLAGAIPLFFSDPLSFLQNKVFVIIICVSLFVRYSVGKLVEVENRGMEFARRQAGRRPTVMVWNGLDDQDKDVVLDRIGYSDEEVGEIRRLGLAKYRGGRCLYTLSTPAGEVGPENALQLVSYALRNGSRDVNGKTTWYCSCLSVHSDGRVLHPRKEVECNPELYIGYVKLETVFDELRLYVIEGLWDLCELPSSTRNVQSHQVLPIRDTLYVVFGASPAHTDESIQSLFKKAESVARASLDRMPCMRVLVVEGYQSVRGTKTQRASSAPDDIRGWAVGLEGALAEWLMRLTLTEFENTKVIVDAMSSNSLNERSEGVDRQLQERVNEYER